MPDKTCLVVGNGPSLAGVGRDVLYQFETFGCNHCQAKFDPTYYVYVDPAMVEEPKRSVFDDINAMTSKKFIVREIAHLIHGSTPLTCVHRMGFSFEPLKHVYAYFSVTTVMLQLAYWMGYRRIGLVGMDHRWETPRGKRAWHPIIEDVNHYHRGYFAGVIEEWKAPRIDLLNNWHDYASGIFDAYGCEVVNLTPGSALKSYEFGKLEDWI